MDSALHQRSDGTLHVGELVALGIRDAAWIGIECPAFQAMPLDVVLRYCSRACAALRGATEDGQLRSTLRSYRAASASRRVLSILAFLSALPFVLRQQLGWNSLPPRWWALPVALAIAAWLINFNARRLGTQVFRLGFRRWIAGATCPECHELLLGAQSADGRTVACPHCSRRVLQAELQTTIADLTAAADSTEVDLAELKKARDRRDRFRWSPRSAILAVVLLALIAWFAFAAIFAR